MEFNNREISWIQFNSRVLQEATDLENPLIERLKFLGIFSNNRDEFFRVRIATIKRMIKLATIANSPQRKRHTTELEMILNLVQKQEIEFTIAFKNIIDELYLKGICLLNEEQLDENQGLFVKNYFKNHVRAKLFPLMLDYFNAGQRLLDSTIYLAVEIKDKAEIEKDRHILIEVPTELPRFLQLESNCGKTYFMFLEDVIRYNLSELFSTSENYTINAYIIKFTRDAELDIDNDVSKSFLEIMEESVKKRTKGIPVRFIYDEKIPEKLLKKIIKKLHITTKNYDLRGGGRYHNFKDLINFPSLNKTLIYKKLEPLEHPDIKPNTSIINKLIEKDILLIFPYHSFDHIIDFLRESSIDPLVKSIKMTFYRAAKDSLAMNALINAARNGKKVTVFMELQARFDEQANILWTQKLQNEGIKVLPTIQGMKVHAKLILVKRVKSGKSEYYSNVGTGNFNESTAKIYSDISLLTHNEDIGHDLNSFFELIESRYQPPKFKLTSISPFNIRNFFEEKINREIENKKQGKEAWAILKLNSIVDTNIAETIYSAARTGVKFNLIIRGINIMQSGIEEFSKNINAFSIVGRYLEHSRIFVFANDGNPEVFISSADLMTRNLDHRFEIVCPILDPEHKKTLLKIIDLQMNDTEKYRSMNYGEVNEYTRKNKNYPKLNSQLEIYNYLKQQL